MAIDYTVLFERLANAVRIDTSLSLAQHNYHQWLEDVLSLYTGDDREAVRSFLDAKDSFRSTLGSLKASLRQQVDALWVRTALQLDPPMASTGTLDCLDAIIADMLDHHEAVDGNTVAITAAAADADNHGDAQVVTSIACLNGTDDTAQLNEFLWPEKKVITCISSSFNTTGEGGSELFQLRGERPVDSALTGFRLFTGQTSQMQAMTATTGLLKNGDFESWTGSTPAADDWTVDTGDWGVEFSREATTTFKGDYCLRLTGDGGVAQLSQAVPIGTLAAERKYVVGVWMRRSAAVAPGVGNTLTVQLATAGHTFGIGEAITLDQADLAALPTTSWTLRWFFFNTPRVVGDWDDLELRITHNMTAGVIVYLDECCLAEPTYDNGVFYAVFSGALPAVEGDFWTMETANDWAGRFQTYAALMYGRMFPSGLWAPYGSTLPDTLIDDAYCWPYAPWTMPAP